MPHPPNQKNKYSRYKINGYISVFFVAVLTLFLKNFLKFEDDTATAVYHAFIVMCYLTPVAGAIISDSCLGKYGYMSNTGFITGNDFFYFL